MPANEVLNADTVVRNPATIALREKVTITVDKAVKEERVLATVTLKDGRKLEKSIENAIGSTTNPMSDQALEAKFLDLADGVLPPAKARRLLDLCWNIETLTGAAEIAKAGAA